MIDQKIIETLNNYTELDNYLIKNCVQKIFLVCGNSINNLTLGKYFDTMKSRIGIEVIKFSDFQPNPSYESIVNGVNKFIESQANTIIAVGGGSAIDVAKCIKIYSNMDHSKNYLQQKIVPNSIHLIAIPTTAGTGSEATRYAVIYYNGEKQSISDFSCIPSLVILDPTVLKTLPLFQKKATMLDALCHSLESFWSVNSTAESLKSSEAALRIILSNISDYLNNSDTGNANMMRASYIAGKAINITQTTAGHAMCYKLTKMYDIPHGYAAALVNTELWPWMIANSERCCDKRGSKHLLGCFEKITEIFNADSPYDAAKLFQNIVNSLNMPVISAKTEADIDILQASVNPVRLKNNPIKLETDDISYIYKRILKITDRN